MNGVSNMLPLVIAGGILMAIVFLFGANSFDPKSSEHNAFAEQLWNIGNKSAFALIIQSYQVSSLVVLQINQVSQLV